MAFIFEYIIFGYEIFVIACIMSLGIGIFWFIISSTKNLRSILHEISGHRTRTRTKTEGNQLNRHELFAEFIYAHNDIKQLSEVLTVVANEIFNIDENESSETFTIRSSFHYFSVEWHMISLISFNLFS